MWRVRRQFWRGCQVACMHWSNQCACCVRTYVEHRYSSPDHFLKRRPKRFSPTEISFIYLRQKQAWLDFSKRLCRPKRPVIVKLTRNVPTEMPSTVSMTKKTRLARLLQLKRLAVTNNKKSVLGRYIGIVACSWRSTVPHHIFIPFPYSSVISRTQKTFTSFTYVNISDYHCSVQLLDRPGLVNFYYFCPTLCSKSQMFSNYAPKKYTGRLICSLVRSALILTEYGHKSAIKFSELKYKT
jgi:hypothetical protein